MQTGTNVFEGTPDARQSADTEAPVSRFRPVYRAISEGSKGIHDEIKAKAAELEALYDRMLREHDAHPASPRRGEAARYRALALTELESSVSWAVKGLTS